MDGITYEFIVEFKGTLSNINRLGNVNGLDLRGEEMTTVTLVGTGPLDGQRIFFLTDPDEPITLETMQDFPNGAVPINDLVEDCFVAGTRILTAQGPVMVEDLKAGDLVRTVDGRDVPVLWSGHRIVPARKLNAGQRPVGVPARYFGCQDVDVLWLSPLHRLKVTDITLDRLFAEPSVFVAARDMPDLQTWSQPDVHYVHILCAQHEVILAEGIPVETLFPPRVFETRLEGADPLALEDIAQGQILAVPALTRKEAALWRRETTTLGLEPV